MVRTRGGQEGAGVLPLQEGDEAMVSDEMIFLTGPVLNCPFLLVTGGTRARRLRPQTQEKDIRRFQPQLDPIIGQ